jgi:hypothetical protein
MTFARRMLALILSLTWLFSFVPAARACGPSSIDPIYVFKNSPDLPFTEYARGRIGIVLPTFGRKTLFIAYRYLNGGSFTTDEQQALLDALRGKSPEDDGDTALKAWIAARAEIVTDEKKLPEIYTERRYGGYDFFPNCTGNAFEVATATLKDRSSTYGPEDKNVRAWLAAQDVVFQNCQGTGEIPAELGPESPAWLRQDRNYQIGAALLYSLNFDAARARFERIANDGESSWHETADYLVGRTLVRQASLSADEKVKGGLYDEAANHLQIIAARPGRFSGAAQKLLALIKYRRHPEERVRELAGILANQSGDDNLKQHLIDYVWLLDKFETRILKEEEERRKKAAAAAGQPSESQDAPYNKEAREAYEAIQRGDQILIIFEPILAGSTPDHQTYFTLYFKFDVTMTEIQQAVEEKVGRKVTPAEINELNTRYASAMENRKEQVSANSRLQRGAQTEHEGCDYECPRLTLNLVPEFLRADDLSDWIFTLQTEDAKAYDHAKAKWRDTESEAWLIGALMKAESTSPQVERLMRTAEGLDRTSPAFPTAAYHLVRLRMALGRKAEARKMLDEVVLPDLANLPVSARNQFLEQRLRLADNLSDFLKFAQRKPVAFYEEGLVGTMHDLFQTAKNGWQADYYELSKEEYELRTDETYRELLLWDDRFSFDDKTLDILNWHFPLTALEQAAHNPAVPEYLRRRLVLAVWTRAVLLGNQEVAGRIAPEVIKVAPEMQPVFMSYLNEKTATEKEHAALFVLLRFPSLSPFVAGGISEFETAETADYYFETSWWCTPSETEYNRNGDEVPKVVPRPTFLTVDQLAAAVKERAALVAIGVGNSYLGKQVIQWAKLSPDDPRIAEALFIAFRANESYKYGCNGWDHNEEIQQEADSILRQRYPGSFWTGKLPQPQ